MEADGDVHDWLRSVDDEGDGGGQDRDLVQHSWEAPILRSWDDIEEDDEGRLRVAQHATQRELRKAAHKRLEARGRERLVEKGMIRYVFIVVDLSSSMDLNDYRPSRKLVAIEAVCQFIRDFFDQNPISHLGLITTHSKKAYMLTDLSGNPLHQIRLLEAQADHHTSGEFSLENSLELARSSLRNTPDYGNREVIIVMASLNTCDPGDVFQTIETMKRDGVRCSVVTLSAELFVCRRLATTTNGTYRVCSGTSAVAAHLAEHVSPPVVPQVAARKRKWVFMGFPMKSSFDFPTLCQCHGNFSYEGYQCPRCKSKCCELPTQCVVCSLTLVSSPHLARSYHHLFPLAPFVDVTEQLSDRHAVECYGCHIEIKVDESLVLRCESCTQVFCWDCDQYIHESLHNCPGCLSYR
ncbi:unnamed protein product (mitochondrion) [Plasmodiophora brassicae]|uniref:General transcription factor IIH subunit n=1 Tax=Plasmodiophora brassicae TaxID=37360 RepID=A0A0G4IXI3_PLABS|nr:hypothetical protein PBRA_007691 [Plasmodiophora brassicae]SPQ99588.1 unnamed protein product [Plasmodiophora brassicae]